MPPLLQPVTYLSPPKGPALVLTDNETWLGRGSFELSEKAQLLCSRKQACLKITKTAVKLECHGLNPIYFVVCHSANFQASQDTPPSRLHQLRRGEAVELVDGDKFYLAPKECLLTVAIKPFKSEDDEASEQLTPEAVHLNVRYDGSLAIQVCSPKATQLGQALTNSVVEQHRLLQTGVPSSSEVCINLYDRCFTEDVCIRCPTEHKRCLCSSDGSCQCDFPKNALDRPFGLQVPVFEDRSVHQVDFSKSARIGDYTRGEVANDTRRGERDASEISVASVPRHSPEQFRLDLSRDPVDPTQAGTLAADSFVHGKGCGSSINASEKILIRSFQPDTVSCVDSKTPLNLGGNSNRDGREGSKQVNTRNVSDRTSSPPLVDRGDPAPLEAVIDTGRSKNVDRIATVSDGEHLPEFCRLDSSTAGGASLNSTERYTLAAICSVEGRGHGTSDDVTGVVIVQSIHPDTIDGGLDSRGPPELGLEPFPRTHEAGEQLVTRNVSGYTSSPLCPGPNQVQDDRPSATDLQQNSLPPGQLFNPAGIPVITGFPEKVGASTSGAILGRYGAAEMLDILMKQGNAEPNSPLKSAPSSQIPPPDDTFSDAPRTICEVPYARESLPKMPEFIDLTLSQNDGKSQAQTKSETAQAGHSTSCNDSIGPIEDMTKVVVTVSGYEDPFRARIINLISAAGAAYTGSLTKLNTHVVCWKFRGAKYEMAKKLGKTIVNHCWFEDCLRAGRRLPEGPYYASGEMSEPLRWDQPVVQCPSSAAGFDHDQDCNSLLSGRSLGHSRSAIVIGESSRSAKTAQSGPSTFSPKGHAGTVDRGKRHVDVNSSANRSDDFLNDRQIRVLTRTGDSPAVDLSTPNRAREQESDDFWNEVMRAYDDRNELVTEPSCQILSEAINIAGSGDNRKGRPRHPSSPILGSSLRELDPYHNEIGSGRRNPISNLAESSRNVEAEELQRASRPTALVREPADNMHIEADHISSYPEVYHRKRKHALEIAKGRSCKSRRLVRKSGVSAAPGDLPSQVNNVVGARVGMTTGSRPDLDTGCAQEEASTVDTTDDRQQTSCVIIPESAGKTGEKGGESTPSNEITCVICHSDSQSMTEGVLACGHQFCYPCIQRWADEAKSKSPTCPLCKVPFDFITFREMANAGEDGSCAVLEERIVQIGQQIPQETRSISLPSLRTENLCVTCGSRDTPELLLVCTNCRERACHTFCLDPPRPPGSSWFCSRCSQIQSRMQTREAYGRLFHGSSPRSAARQRQGTVDVEMNIALQSRSISHDGALVVGQSSGHPPGMNQAPQSGSTSRVDGLVVRQSSGTPPRRGRQYSLHSFLVRLNDS